MPNSEPYVIYYMSIFWENTFIYAFPPLSMIWLTINKIEKKAEKALIMLIWPTQTWFIRALELAAATPALPEAETDGHMLLQEQTPTH